MAPSARNFRYRRSARDTWAMNSSEPIQGLAVYASGSYPVQISRGHRIMAAHRADLTAEVDPETGEVRFFVKLEDLPKLR